MYHLQLHISILQYILYKSIYLSELQICKILFAFFTFLCNKYKVLLKSWQLQLKIRYLQILLYVHIYYSKKAVFYFKIFRKPFLFQYLILLYTLYSFISLKVFLQIRMILFVFSQVCKVTFLHSFSSFLKVLLINKYIIEPVLSEHHRSQLC